MAFLRGMSVGRTSRWQVALLFFCLNVVASLQFSATVEENINNHVILQFGNPPPVLKPNTSIQVPYGAYVGHIYNSSLICNGILSSSSYYAGMVQERGANFSAHGSATGSCLYDTPVQLTRTTSRDITSFGTMFQLTLGPTTGLEGTTSGAQMSFIITNDTSNQHTDNYFAVNFHFSQDAQQVSAPFQARVDLSVNKLSSDIPASKELSSETVSFAGGPASFYVWIQYDFPVLEVYASGKTNAFQKPTSPLFVTHVNLTEALSQDDMYVGFSGSTQYDASLPSTQYNASFPPFTYVSVTEDTFNIFGWTFNSDGPAPDFPRLSNGEVGDPIAEAARAAEKRKQQIIRITAVMVPSIVLLLLLVVTIVVLYKRNARLTALAKKYEIIEDDLLDQGPQSFRYKVLSAATKGFSSHALLGSGGFGSVYRGKLWLKGAATPTEIAVKRISATSHQGAREFLAEVKIIGQVQHRNLVRLLGWCHQKGELMLVYEYMPNGSVDQHLFKDTDDSGQVVLTWSRRLKIVSGVASALAYLHEDWEQRVIHRDVKSSNVMLDSDFNARLGDFGLARLSAHDQAPPSTAILAGTYGYLAPEMAHTFKATEKTDVYSFGAMVLEVATGKRPILSYQDQQAINCVLLVDWVWSLYRNDNLLEAADCKLQGAFDLGEMVMFLKIGLLCSHPDPNERPNMREVINIWKGSTRFPPLPRTKPVPTFAASVDGFDTEATLYRDDSGHPDESSDQVAFIRSSKDRDNSVPSSHASHWGKSSSMPPLRSKLFDNIVL